MGNGVKAGTMKTRSNATLLVVTCAIGSQAAGFAATVDISNAFGTAAPTTRGSANSSWVGWDTWDDGGAGNSVINDSTPDIGSGSGVWATNNNEDHISGSFNFYSGQGSVNETISFNANGVPGSGFTTILLQGSTLFGDFGTTLGFGDIAGVSPTVVQGLNATGAGQVFARYELPGNAEEYSVNMVTGPFSFVSFGNFEVDTFWSATGFSPDTAVIPEPSSGLLVLSATGLLLRRRRRN